MNGWFMNDSFIPKSSHGDQASWCLLSGDEQQGHKKVKRHEQETWSGL